jgi:hypothetical protein
VRSDTLCPGCGARNAPEARVCDWCGRPFLLRDQRRHGRFLWVVGTLICLLAVGGLTAMALLRGAPGPWPLLRQGATPLPTVAPAPAVELTAPAPAGPDAPPEPTAEVAEYVQVVNTGGQGIILRREPSTAAPRVVARAEHSILRVVGPDEVVEGRVWRQVEDAQGNRGWTLAEFLAPVAPPR